MSGTKITIEQDGLSDRYELCVGEYEDPDRRVRHEDFFLSREELWQLKQEVDKAWFAGWLKRQMSTGEGIIALVILVFILGLLLCCWVVRC